MGTSVVSSNAPQLHGLLEAELLLWLQFDACTVFGFVLLMSSVRWSFGFGGGVGRFWGTGLWLRCRGAGLGLRAVTATHKDKQYYLSGVVV